MIDVFDEVEGPVIAVERVPPDAVGRYGIIDAEPIRPRVYRIRDLVEKPAPGTAPSNLAIIGRYVLTPDIFRELERTRADAGGEIQLTNGLRSLLDKRPLHAYEIAGTRHDTGNKIGFICASLYFALKRPELADAVRDYIRSIDLEGALWK
jgi:UTP--glucose-1-phosphate uridylyltransferase